MTEEERLDNLTNIAVKEYYDKGLDYEGVDLDAFVDAYIDKFF